MSKRYKVTGIGNAIVDLLVAVDDQFLSKFNLEKGEMRLIDKSQADLICQQITPSDQIAGGSAANTIAGLASLGNLVAFIGKVGRDEMGNLYEKNLEDYGVHCHLKKSSGDITTARSIVLITPDAQRTFNTYLGIAEQLSAEDVNEETVKNSELLYLEGYLWDKPAAKEAYRRATDIAHKNGNLVAISLSDSFCVDRHREGFLNLVKNHVDLVFANEREIMALFQTDSLEFAIGQTRKLKCITVITKGKNGSVTINDNKIYENPASQTTAVVDTTGAGDLFAAGFLHGYINNLELSTCGHMGSLAAAEIISHYGARPKISLAKLFKKHFS